MYWLYFYMVKIRKIFIVETAFDEDPMQIDLVGNDFPTTYKYLCHIIISEIIEHSTRVQKRPDTVGLKKMQYILENKINY